MAASDHAGVATAPNASTPDRSWWPFASRRWEAADTVIAVVSALIFVIFTVFAFLCIQGFGTTLEAAKKRAQVSADIVATQGSWLLGSGLTALRLIDSKLAFEPAVLDPGEKAELDNALKALPAGGHFAIYDPNGAVLPNGGSPTLPVSIADLPYFAELRDSPAGEIIARQQLDSATGAPIMVEARRLGGEVNAGYVVLAMPVMALEAFFQAQGLAEGSVISIAREDGTIVARYPLATEPIDVTQSASWEQISTTQSGTYEARSALDGVTRLIGYRHVPELGIITFGSVSKDAAFASLWIGNLHHPVAAGTDRARAVRRLAVDRALLRRSARTQRTLAAAVDAQRSAVPRDPSPGEEQSAVGRVAAADAADPARDQGQHGPAHRRDVGGARAHLPLEQFRDGAREGLSADADRKHSRRARSAMCRSSNSSKTFRSNARRRRRWD